MPTTVVGESSSRMVRPMIVRSAPKRRLHSPSLSTTTRGAERSSSPATKARPRAGFTPRTSKKFADTRACVSRSGSPEPVRLVVLKKCAAIPENDLLWARQSRKSGGDTAVGEPLMTDATATRRSGSAYGSSRSRTPRTTLKIAVSAPTPNASVNAETTTKPRPRPSTRSA